MPTFSSAPSNQQNFIVKKPIRNSLKKSTSELIKADLKKVPDLESKGFKIADAGLEELPKLQQLSYLDLMFREWKRLIRA